MMRADGGRAEAAEAHGKSVMDPKMTGGGHSGMGRLQKEHMKQPDEEAAGD
jgi:hypothetical protein